MISVLQVLAGLAILFAGGELLVRGASSLALRMGVSRLAIGLTVVAFGTSAPELIVSLDAASRGVGDISIGNVVGSNIANVSLILGLSALFHPLTVQAKVVRLDAPIMVFTSLCLVAVMADGEASRGDGILLLAGLVAFVVFTYWEGSRESEAIQEEFTTAAPTARPGLGLSALSALGGLALLMFGGQLLVGAAVSMATAWGVPPATIGLTIVAVGTSLPEAVTSVVASFRGQGDIAIGNVVGSNIFNVLGILGVTSVVGPLSLGAITAIDLGVMVGVAVALAVLLLWRRSLGRLEGGALLAVFVVYTVWLLGA